MYYSTGDWLCKEKKRKVSSILWWCCRPAIVFGLWRWVAHCNAPDNTHTHTPCVSVEHKILFFFSCVCFCDRSLHTKKFLLKSNCSVSPLQKKKKNGRDSLKKVTENSNGGKRGRRHGETIESVWKINPIHRVLLLWTFTTQKTGTVGHFFFLCALTRRRAINAFFLVE